jgi:uncharacterized membrane protein YfcA
MPIHLDAWQWATLVLATFLVGLSKTGISGIGTFAVAIFALVLPARESVGAVLPILICGDIVAVTAYRRHAVWAHLWGLFPCAVAGVILGYAALGRINAEGVAKLVGGILLVVVVLQWWRQRGTGWQSGDVEPHVPHRLWFVVAVGMLAGFTTMVANAAGPIMIVYLLAMRLPKMEFIGTGAWYFLLMNLFKVPFSSQLGLINPASLLLDLKLAPVAVVGALVGRALIPYIDQALFETLALVFTFLAALRLVF